MQILLILFVVLIAATVFLTYLLYTSGNDVKKHNTVYILSAVLAFILSFIAFSAIPDNYTTQRLIAGAWPILTVASLGLKYIVKGNSKLPEILLSVATFAALAQMLFV